MIDLFGSRSLGSDGKEKEIYQAVLNDAGLDAATTLFIDDKSENTEAAAALGMQVYHLTDRDLPAYIARQSLEEMHKYCSEYGE